MYRNWLAIGAPTTSSRGFASKRRRENMQTFHCFIGDSGFFFLRLLPFRALISHGIHGTRFANVGIEFKAQLVISLAMTI
jgi:hypothetical protein